MVVLDKGIKYHSPENAFAKDNVLQLYFKFQVLY